MPLSAMSFETGMLEYTLPRYVGDGDGSRVNTLGPRLDEDLSPDTTRYQIRRSKYDDSDISLADSDDEYANSSYSITPGGGGTTPGGGGGTTPGRESYVGFFNSYGGAEYCGSESTSVAESRQ